MQGGPKKSKDGDKQPSNATPLELNKKRSTNCKGNPDSPLKN